MLRLGLAGFLGAVGVTPWRARAFAATKRAAARARRCRYLVQICPRGGLDGILTTDPKPRSELEAWVDRPFEDNELVSTDGGHVLGPHLRALAPFSDRIVLVKNLAVQTAVHEVGLDYAACLRTEVTPEVPAIIDLIGSYREGQPLASVTFGFQAGTFPSTLLAALDGADPEDLAALAASYRRRSRSLAGQGQGSLGVRTADNLDQCAELFTRLPGATRFTPETWETSQRLKPVDELFQRLAWAIENDLAAAFSLTTRSIWDSHFYNLTLQGESSETFFPMLARFLHELERRKNQHGVLADNTLVVIGSEIGRFPRLNTMSGKDHFPEVPYVLVEPKRGSAGVFGRTGSRLEALPVSMSTGQPVREGGRRPLLDDLGTTLLHRFGIEPTRYGYDGVVMEPLA
jgi:hypothetical protein